MKITKPSNLTFKFNQEIFLDTISYKDKKTTSKTTDEQAFLHAKSEHPRLLKNSIPYS